MPKLNLSRKYLLLDTCLLIKWFAYSETAFFDDFFSLLATNRCTPVINEFIKFEFLRNCQSKKHIRAKNNFLDALSGGSGTLPLTPDIIKNGIKISNIYSNKKIDPRQISIVDCYISAYLQKYHQKLVLVTLDNNDFPLIIHDRIGIRTIDTDKEILVLGFYKFNDSNYKKRLNDIGI